MKSHTKPAWRAIHAAQLQISLPVQGVLRDVRHAVLGLCTDKVGLTPGVDQRTLARSIGLDTSTTAGVIDRLETRGLMQHKASPEDRRVRLLSLIDEGKKLLQAVEPDMLKAQRRIPRQRPAAERDEFMRMLRKLVTANNELSAAPSEA